MNTIVAISQDMWALKHCYNKILQFLKGSWLMQVDLYNGRKVVVFVTIRYGRLTCA